MWDSIVNGLPSNRSTDEVLRRRRTKSTYEPSRAINKAPTSDKMIMKRSSTDALYEARENEKISRPKNFKSIFVG